MADDPVGAHKKNSSSLRSLFKYFGKQVKDDGHQESASSDDKAELIEFFQDNSVQTDTLEMIKSIINMSEVTIRDIMVPRANMVSLQEGQTLEEMLKIITESGHSRFPVLSATNQDEVIGILLSKDLLQHFDQKDINVTPLLRKAQYETEEKNINTLLKEFKASKTHLALVLDEYGLLSGLVTIEDILEEIVGEITDEHDKIPESLIHPIDGKTYLVSAMISIEQFNDYFKSNFDEEIADAIGGIIMTHLGRLPKDNELINFPDLSIEVMPFSGNRLEMLKVIVKSNEITND